MKMRENYSFYCKMFTSMLLLGYSIFASDNLQQANNATQPLLLDPPQAIATPPPSPQPAPIKKEATQHADSPDVAVEKKSVDTVDTAAKTVLVEKNDLPIIDDTTKQTLEKIEQKANNFDESQKIEDDQEPSIHLNFEDADLQQLVAQVQALCNVTFINAEILNPLPKNGQPLEGHKLSFKSNKPLSKNDVWDFFLTILHIAGFALIEQGAPYVFRIITTINQANKSPLPTFIGTKPSKLPNNDQIIRYVYFFENSSVDSVKNIIDSLRSTTSNFFTLKDFNAFVLTDKAYNIKHLMKIITELDTSSLPETMSVLKLKKANASEVKRLYDSLIKTNIPRSPTSVFPKKESGTEYFSSALKIIVESRTNSLILLGPLDAIQKIEEFVIKHVDVDLDKPYSPLRIYRLKYADATTVATIMNDVTKFGGAGKGASGTEVYLKGLVFTAEPETNSIIIKGKEEDYLQAKTIIEKLDEPQPQVAIEVLILSVVIKDEKKLGAQIRSKRTNNKNGLSGLIGDNVAFQTSGFNGTRGIVTKSTGPGVDRLLGDLISLATGVSGGNTLISLGKDTCGVWGIFNILQTVSNAQVISNPFLVATNKQPASVSVGEERRVITGEVITGTTKTPTFGNDEAKLVINITPQINNDGFIVLDLKVELNQFTNAIDASDAQKTTKEVNTSTIVANKEVLALGGLIQNSTRISATQTPLLSRIPIFGWLFKNQAKTVEKESLLVLISAEISKPIEGQYEGTFTQRRVKDYRSHMHQFESDIKRNDPINILFFDKKSDTPDDPIEDLIFKNQKKVIRLPEPDSQRKKRRRRRKRPVSHGIQL